MAEGKSIMAESCVPSQQGQLMFDEIVEEILVTDTIERQNKDKRQLVCDRCYLDGFMNAIALYFCIVCGRYFCEKCFTGHGRSPKYIRAESKDRELESEISEFVSFMMDESDDESEKRLFEDDVCVCDYVDTKHELDKVVDCCIDGITGYDYKWWVFCDYDNYCIKVFSSRSNVLQRYIRLGSGPFDVTEIIVDYKTTEQDSASCSETTISGTDNKPDSNHLLAVTLPEERLILIINLGQNPAFIHSKIKTERYCYGIDFYDGKIYTVCEELSLDPPYSVSILSLEGVTMKTFQTDVTWYSFPHLTVLNENIYMTDYFNNRVVCYNDEGQVLHEIKIAGSLPDGICVDRNEDKVYVCSLGHDNVYELKSDLSRYKPVLDQTTRYMERPRAMCFYSDKLYAGHGSESESHVTVVRLL